MEEVYGEHFAFVVIAEDVGVIALDSCDALLLLQQIDSGDQVAIFCSQLILFAFGRRPHALLQRARQVSASAFEEQLHVMHRFGVALGRGQPLDTWAQASPDVVLQTGPRIVAIQVQLAGRNQEMPVNQIDKSIRQAGREVRSEVERAVFAQSPRRKHSGIALGDGQLDVGIRLVVAQKDVVARLLLLDEVVLERQRFFLVVDDDVVEIDRLAQQRSGFGIGRRAFQKIRPHSRAQVVGLADVDDLALGVLVEIHAGRGRQGSNFLVKVHEKQCQRLAIAQSFVRAFQSGRATQRFEDVITAD